jgi:NAD/NADP transhydrogenase alpha subunit
LLPGRDAPRLIKAETVAKMKPGSVILDMAVETGGNVEGSKDGETVVTENGVKILGIPNIPATVRQKLLHCMHVTFLISLKLYLTKRKTLRSIKKTKFKSPSSNSWRSSTAQAWLRRVMVETITIFVLAIFVGYYVVWGVTPALHTPLWQ